MDLFQLLPLSLGWGVLLRSPISNGPCSKVLFLNVYLEKKKEESSGGGLVNCFRSCDISSLSVMEANDAEHEGGRGKKKKNTTLEDYISQRRNGKGRREDSKAGGD